MEIIFMDKNEEFMNFLDMLSKMNKSREDNDMHLAKFLYSKYKTFMEAGFNEDQAFKLVLAIIGGLTAKL